MPPLPRPIPLAALVLCLVVAASACLVDADIGGDDPGVLLDDVEAVQPHPTGFGLGGLHPNWKNDARRWLYNWGWPKKDTEAFAADPRYLPMIWGGPFCARWGELKAASLGPHGDDAGVERYRKHLCYQWDDSRQALVYDARCQMDTRTLIDRPEGTVESITAYGRYVNFYSWLENPDGSKPKAQTGLLTSVPRYCGELVNGVCRGFESWSPDTPCDGKSGYQCQFDTREFFDKPDGQRLEVITAQGRQYTYVVGEQRPDWSKALTEIGAFCPSVDENGFCDDKTRPCFGKKGHQCRFDSRARAVTGNGVVLDSITANGKYYNFVRPGYALHGHGNLRDVEKYRWGACLEQPDDQPCVFDTRVVKQTSTGPMDSITVGNHKSDIDVIGGYANFYSGNEGQPCRDDDPSLLAYLERQQKYIDRFPGPGRKWLIFNEPDVQPQSNMPAHKAAHIYSLVEAMIRSQDSQATLYCCGTAPSECGNGHCGDWMERFSAALPPGTPPPDRIHYHNYATDDDHRRFFATQKIIDGMIDFSERMNVLYPGKRILISEWAGLSHEWQNRCGAQGYESNVDLMRETAQWLVDNADDYRYDGAAWFVDWCDEGPNCSEGSMLYGQRTSNELTCLGDVYFDEIIPSWD